MASLVGSIGYGASKRGNVVPFKYQQGGCTMSVEGWNVSFDTIIAKVKTNGLQKKAIINMSLSKSLFFDMLLII